MGVAAAVLGASGYVGGEILRYLSGHPGIEIAVVGGATSAGRQLRELHPQLSFLETTIVDLGSARAAAVDVAFACLPRGEFHDDAVAAGRIVDLSDDHRGASGWVYGLTEYARGAVADAERVANPGCYPTAALLCLLPFIKSGILSRDPIVVDALSGTSGAGRAAADNLMHASAEQSSAAYGTVTHRHIPEIERCLSEHGGSDVVVSFTPHLVPMTRGLIVTARARLDRLVSDGDALDLLSSAYVDEPFVVVTEEWPAAKWAAGTNFAFVSARVDRRAGFLVASAAIDNLGKGAAGQAVQNANLMLGFEETTGLEATGVWP